MSKIFEPLQGLALVKLPPQDIDVLSFCKSNKVAKVKEWVDSLKVTQIDQAAVAFYNSVPELSHLKTDVTSRFAMLEIFWPKVQQCLLVFSKEYLQQPLILPPKAQKSAIISQALQRHLLDGYSVCIQELVKQKKLKASKQEFLLNCTYRAMQALSRLMLRSYQLYNPIPQTMWLRAHTLLQVAEAYGLQSKIAPISVFPGCIGQTIHQVYLQITAMGCIHPNQLSQNDLCTTHDALDQWSKHISLFPAEAQDENNVFVVNLSKDLGPHEKIRGNDAELDRILELDFQSLVKQLNGLSNITENIDNTRSGNKLTIPPQMGATLLQHILECWSTSAERKQTRKSIEIKAEACIGIIDCHFHISGKIDFNQFITATSAGDEDDDNGSYISSGFDQLISNMSNNDTRSKPAAEKESIFDVTIQNLSPGGYCLAWKNKFPTRIESGELIGIREAGRRAWSIGIIRWIRQSKNNSQMGIQILCNQPIPYGASVTLDNGLESDYMRVIHIPAPTMSDQPPSLLTTTIPFQEGRRAELKQDDHNTTIRLGKSVFSTGKLKLFSFETIGQEG